MAAQRLLQHGPVTPVKSVIAPPSPRMGGASLVDMLDTNDLSLRRARLNIPFYAEEEAGSRNGALAESLGFLPDLTQIVECLQVGFEGSGPLTATAIDAVIADILNEVTAFDVSLHQIGKFATDFDKLQYLIEGSEEQYAQSAQSAPFRRPEHEAPPPPCSVHWAIMWLIEHGWAIANISAATDASSYNALRLHRISVLDKDDLSLMLREMDDFHRDELISLDVGLADESTIEQATRDGDYQTVARLSVQLALRSELQLVILLAEGGNMEDAASLKAETEMLIEQASKLMQSSAPTNAEAYQNWRHRRAQPAHPSNAAPQKSLLTLLKDASDQLSSDQAAESHSHASVHIAVAGEKSSGFLSEAFDKVATPMSHGARLNTRQMSMFVDKSTADQDEAALAARMARMPRYLQMSKQKVMSAPHGVKRTVIDSIVNYDGSNEPTTLRMWAQSLADAMLQVPGGDTTPSLQPYMMYMSLSGRAKECLRVENARLVADGKTELHNRADNGDSIMDLMYRSFVFDDENEFVLNFMQLVRSHWRDPRAPSENLREYHQRFSQHLRMASSYYDNMVQMIPPLTARLHFITGLPQEVQSMIVTQTDIPWDAVDLSGEQENALFDMMFQEYDLRVRRGESLTPQIKFSGYPTATLDKRSSSVASLDSHAADVVDGAAAGFDGSKGKSRARDTDTFKTNGRQLLKELEACAISDVVDKLISIYSDKSKGPIQLIKLCVAIMSTGSNDLKTYAGLEKASEKHRAIFHSMLAVMFSQGKHKKGDKGKQGMRLGLDRFPDGQKLPKDADGKTLYDYVDAASISKLLAIPMKDWRTTPALAEQATHFIREPDTAKMVPACFVCGETGHQCGQCLRHLHHLKAKGEITSIPSVSGTQYTFGHAVSEVCVGDVVEVQLDDNLNDLKASALHDVIIKSLVNDWPVPSGSREMEDDQIVIDEFVVDLHPDLVDRQVATMYFNGVPVKVFFDTGAQRTMVTRETAERIGLPIRRPRNPLRIRNVEDKLGSIIDEVIKSTPLSSLNGEISVTVPDMLVTNSLPDCGVLAGRDLIYAVLRAVVHVDRLECFCTHQPDGERPPVPTSVEDRKIIPFEGSCISGKVFAVQGCGDITEVMFADGDVYDSFQQEASSQFTLAALAVTPKKRTRQQRVAVAQHKQDEDSLFDSGPLPQGDNPYGVSGGPATSNMTYVPDQSVPGGFSVMAAVASTMLMVSTAVGGVSSNSLDLSAHSQPGEGWVFPMHDARPDFDWTFKTNDPVDNETAVASLTQTILGVSNSSEDVISSWYDDMGITSTVDLNAAEQHTRANLKCDDDAATDVNATRGSSKECVVTQERWYPLLRYEALTRPAGADTLRKRLKAQDFDVPVARVQLALDVIDPITGNLLDAAPYPAVYEYVAQTKYEYDHPERIRAMHQLAREQMIQAKLRMADTENANRSEQVYKVGDMVRLKLDHIQLPVWAVSKCRKLRGKYFGSFPVTAVHSPLAIELKLPVWLHQNIHPVFHPMYLKPASTSSLDVGLRKTLGTIFEPADYGVEKILAHRRRKNATEYLVQWESCSY